jgi:hypothetical protein
VSEPVRILLRLVGLVMLLAGIAAVILLFEPGPAKVAKWMSNSCAHGQNEEAEACNVLDVLEFLAFVPILILVGGVIALALGPDRGEGAGGARTIDLSRFR